MIENIKKAESRLTIKISMEINQDYVENFFGARIYDVAVAVGQNGAGKQNLPTGSWIVHQNR